MRIFLKNKKMTNSSTKIHEKIPIQFYPATAGRTQRTRRKDKYTSPWRAWSEWSKTWERRSSDRLYAFRLWRPTPRRWITPGEPPVANWDKQCFVCRGNLDSLRFPLASLLRNFSWRMECMTDSSTKETPGAPVAWPALFFIVPQASLLATVLSWSTLNFRYIRSSV